MNEKKEGLKHKVVIEDRKVLMITGVNKVKSFDPKEIVLDTVEGGLVIKGRELGVKNLDLEQSEIEVGGSIEMLTYSTNRVSESSKGVWERMFK